MVAIKEIWRSRLKAESISLVSTAETRRQGLTFQKRGTPTDSATAPIVRSNDCEKTKVVLSLAWASQNRYYVKWVSKDGREPSLGEGIKWPTRGLCRQCNLSRLRNDHGSEESGVQGGGLGVFHSSWKSSGCDSGPLPNYFSLLMRRPVSHHRSEDSSHLDALFLVVDIVGTPHRCPWVPLITSVNVSSGLEVL